MGAFVFIFGKFFVLFLFQCPSVISEEAACGGFPGKILLTLFLLRNTLATCHVSAVSHWYTVHGSHSSALDTPRSLPKEPNHEVADGFPAPPKAVQ